LTWYPWACGAGNQKIAQLGWVCYGCQHENWQGQEFFLRCVDAWPATPKDDGNAQTFIHTTVFEQFRRLRFHGRAVGVDAFLHML
jgi:hypothetical protein